MATNKNGFGIAAIILLLLLVKKKKLTSVVVEPAETTHSSDADYLVSVNDGARFYDTNKNITRLYSYGVQKLDGFNSNELPLWIKVRMNGVKYYLKAGDFKIL